MLRKLLLVLLLSMCSACTYVTTLRISASLDPATPPTTPADQAVIKFAAYLVTKGLIQLDPKTFGANGRYDFHTFHGTRMFGMDQDDEYVTVYAGDADTVIIEVARISDSVKPIFPDDVIEKTRSQAEKYLHEATGNTYKVVVVQRN